MSDYAGPNCGFALYGPPAICTCGTCTPMTRPDAVSDLVERNTRVARRYDELMREGKHGHYETLFRVVNEEVRSLSASLFETIKHGDAEHQAWLQEAIDAHFVGKQVPPPSGSSNKEKRIAELEAINASLFETTKERC